MSLMHRMRELIDACFAGIWIESQEHEDAIAELGRLCAEEDWQLAVWDVDRGLQSYSGGDLGIEAADHWKSQSSFGCNLHYHRPKSQIRRCRSCRQSHSACESRGLWEQKYGPQGTSIICYRDRTYCEHQYFIWPKWPGGSYASPGIWGSRSGGLFAATWAVMLCLGKAGYLQRAKPIFETSYAMQQAIQSHQCLYVRGKPAFGFAFKSNDFNVYHINDHMRPKGWRFNGVQRPDALDFYVTEPSTHPEILEAFQSDLAEAVVYAQSPPQPEPQSSAFYGGAGMRIDDPDLMRYLLTAGMNAFCGNPIANFSSNEWSVKITLG